MERIKRCRRQGVLGSKGGGQCQVQVEAPVVLETLKVDLYSKDAQK